MVVRLVRDLAHALSAGHRALLATEGHALPLDGIEAHPQRAERRPCLEPVALLDELSRSDNQFLAGHDAGSPPMNASRSDRARRAHGPGTPAPMGSPASRVTGRMPATLLDRNASSAAARSAMESHVSLGSSPTRPAQPRIQERVVPGRIAHPSAGVASSSPRT